MNNPKAVLDYEMTDKVPTCFYYATRAELKDVLNCLVVVREDLKLLNILPFWTSIMVLHACTYMVWYVKM